MCPEHGGHGGGREPDVNGLPPNLEWVDGCLRVLDQRALPGSVRYLECRDWESVAQAVRSLAIRGAPAIGIAGAYGVALAALSHRVDSPAFATAVAALSSARPTAVNLAWAVHDAAGAAASAGGEHAAASALTRARRLHADDAARCAAIARLGAELLSAGDSSGWVLTHCHTGAMATGGAGTALGAILEAFRRGRIAGVFACEARPLWQGARLTAWECGVLGVPCRVLVDGAGGTLLASGQVRAVLVGADRIAANGDVANKIGTYPLAVLSARHQVPFYVAAPFSTVDVSLADGSGVVIEERDPGEVLQPAAAPGAGAYNPAFDVTPGSLISAIVTESAVHRRPYHFSVIPRAKAPEEA